MYTGLILKYENQLWLKISYKLFNCCPIKMYDKYYLLQNNKVDQELVAQTDWGHLSVSNIVENMDGEVEIIEELKDTTQLRKSKSENDLCRLRVEKNTPSIVNIVDLFILGENIPLPFINSGTTWPKIKLKKSKMNQRYKVLKFALFEKGVFTQFIKIPLKIKIYEF